jgi:outer membrane protein OmpA-like peptidoglycan-associated protein
MSKTTLLSIGLALLGAAALPLSTPALAASPVQSAAAARERGAPDIVFNRIFIFFRNDDASLTPLMAKQVTRAAELAKQGGATRIKITGYSDDAKRPEALGQARAETVKAALIGQGISADSIETQPRVKAPPASNVGGPSPANHRVRIALIRAFAAPVGPRDNAP